jgi:hypothetical protein
MKKSANNTYVIKAVKTTAAVFLKTVVFSIFISLTICNGFAQQAASGNDLLVKLAERSKKIVNSLSLTDSGVYNYTVAALTAQYSDVNKVHDNTKAIIADIKSKNLAKEETEKMIAEETAKKNAVLKELHTLFIKTLSVKLTEDKIDKIKDGMTYNVFPITYAAYQKMILALTDSQKQKIYDWLKEARELAMDEGSSDDKHKMFGKYKGKINNYLSAEGYDVKKEGEEWAKREEAEKKARQSSQN